MCVRDLVGMKGNENVFFVFIEFRSDKITFFSLLYKWDVSRVNNVVHRRVMNKFDICIYSQCPHDIFLSRYQWSTVNEMFSKFFTCKLGPISRLCS